MSDQVEIIVDNRLRMRLKDLPASVVEQLREAFTHKNPVFEKASRMGFKGWNLPKTISTWRIENDEWFTVPLGGLGRVRAALHEAGLSRKIVDQRSIGTGPRGIPPHRFLNGGEMWDFQQLLVDTVVKFQIGICRSPTGSGKTSAALALAAKLDLPTLVLVSFGELFNQWIRRADAELGLGKHSVGMIRGSLFKIKPLTIAMVQTATKHVAQLRGVFGLVICDECFEGSTPVLMADGTLKRIEDVQVGDDVAVGGKVRATMHRLYSGGMVHLGDSFVTAGHPIATGDGWMSAAIVRSSDDLWYDPQHAVRTLWSKVANGLSTPDLSEAWRWQFRCVDGQVSCLRERGSETEASCARIDQVRDCACLEQGQDQGDRRERALVLEQAQRAEASDGREEDARSLARSEATSQVGARHCKGSTQAVCRCLASCSVASTRAGNDCRWADTSVRWKNSREWGSAYECRAGNASAAHVDGIPSRVRSTNRSAKAASLQGRLGTSGIEGGSRDRRQQPSPCETPAVRPTQDILPRVEDVAGAALPGAVRLQRGRSHVQACGVLATCRVHNLETERGVYVAAGVLVHNCQKFAAPSLFSCVDHLDSKYRVAISDLEKRRDRKEFLLYDCFGDVIADIDDAELIDRGIIHDVEVRVVPTAFDAPWLREIDDKVADLEGRIEEKKADGEEGAECKALESVLSTLKRERAMSFDRVVKEMQHDEARNALVRKLVRDEVADGEQVLVLSHRREHCRRLDADLSAMGIRTGLFLGSEEDSAEFARTREGIMAKSIRAAAGTYQAIGTGFDLPSVAVGIATTPIANSADGKPFFRQVRGRLCRTAEGKSSARFYYLWDQAIYSDRPLKNLRRWSRTVVVLDGGEWVPIKEFLRRMKERAEAEAEA